MTRFLTPYRVQKNIRRLKWAITSRLYIDRGGEAEKSILIAGTGRSGTTWLADLLAANIPSRLMFEPFHSGKVAEISQFPLFPYLRADEQNPDWFLYSHKVVTGKIRHRWIDWQTEVLFPRQRIIKEIRGNLFLKWFKVNFPQVPMVMIFRHPCAVVLSRMELDWATDSDIEPFLRQDRLVKDHLQEYIDLIRAAKTEEEKHAILWCVHYLVPLRQFGPGELTTCFYEDLCVQPERELQILFDMLKQESPQAINAAAGTPSATAWRNSAVITGGDRVARWKKALSERQINLILDVVREFGLDYLYGDSLLPRKTGVLGKQS